MRRLLLLAVMAVAIPVALQAQISPGPLARAHQSLEGTTRCTSCHGASKDAMPRLCLSCHKEVAWLIAQGRGVHAREARTSGKTCASCHPDHAGRDFQMVAWPSGSAASFDHRGAGWPLEGKHASTACEKCHRPEFRNGPAAALSPRKSNAGWMGLETTCASCHRRDDPHANALGADCQRCHDEAGWKPAPKFDHAQSRYPLTGKHAGVTCDKCHLAAALNIQADASGKRNPKFRPLAFAECSSCHADPHRGGLGPKCSSCHVTQGFDVLDRRDFNHAATRFPLLGKHRTVGCEACHGRGMATPKPAFARCADCHADVHHGEATLAGAPVDCASCHPVDGFQLSTFTVAQHQATRFPLGGKHQAVKCSACHTSTAANAGAARFVRIRFGASDCAACHADSHGGQLPGTPCKDCHSDAGWTAVSYARHPSTPLPLDGAHQTLSCASCHGPARPGLAPLTATRTLGHAGVLFRIGETRCSACHANPHPVPAGRSADSLAACESCHSRAAFQPSTIDVAVHQRFGFALEGAHRAVPCAACHAGMSETGASAASGSTLVAALRAQHPVPLNGVKGTTCAACHQSPHGTQFAGRADGGRCDACHDAGDFAQAPRFNHDRDASFALAGAHASVACDKCHKNRTVDGHAQVTYRPLPHRCEDCHAARRPGGRR